MYKANKVILIFLIMLTTFSHLFAQGIKNSEKTEKDSSVKNQILLQDFFHRNYKGFKLLIPPENALGSQYPFSDFEYNTTDHFYFADNHQNTFEKGMAQLLLIGYKDLTKYDLGTIGKYLGISKNILAIILAILSTM